MKEPKRLYPDEDIFLSLTQKNDEGAMTLSNKTKWKKKSLERDKVLQAVSHTYVSNESDWMEACSLCPPS